jgi:YadA-like membrane anchor domain
MKNKFQKHVLIVGLMACISAAHAVTPVDTRDLAISALELSNYNSSTINALRADSADFKHLAAAGVASAAALSQPAPAVAAGESALTVGIGAFEGQNAVGVQYLRGISSSTLLSAGVASSTGTKSPIFRAGVSVKF